MTLEEIYLEWYKTKDGKSSYKAMNGYKTAYNHLSKYYSTPFADLRTAHLQIVIDNLHKEGKSRPLMVKVKSLLSMLYNYGMQNDIVGKNYAQFIQLPKTTRKEKKRFSDFDIARIEQLAKTEDMAQLLLVLIYTGFRINELLAITRFNVDLDKMIITGGGKTDAGTDRAVPIHAKILPIIRDWVKRDDFVVIDGKVRQYNNIAVLFREFKTKYNFDDDLTLHCTRHTCASLMAAKGIDPIYMTKILGHSNYNLTAKVYTHLDTLALYQEINKI
jgi:integrase